MITAEGDSCAAKSHPVYAAAVRALLVTVAMLAACYSPSSRPSDQPQDAQPGQDAAPTQDAPPVVTGCPANKLTGNDEDGDQVDDGCDLCPLVPNGNVADPDGDGVGAACDPNSAADSVWLFDSFAGATTTWTVVAPWTRANGQLRAETTTEASITMPAASRANLDNFTITATIVVPASLPTNNAQNTNEVGFFILGPTSEFNCFLGRRSGGADLVVEVVGENTSDGRQTPFAWVNGTTYQLSVERRGGTYTCRVQAQGGTPSASLTFAANVDPMLTNGLGMWIYRLTAEFKSVFVVGPR